MESILDTQHQRQYSTLRQEVLPLGAAVFYKVGRHPLAGLSAAFAGVSGGFGVNLVITPVDGMLTEILNDAVHII